jgi:hypothetical protein
MKNKLFIILTTLLFCNLSNGQLDTLHQFNISENFTVKYQAIFSTKDSLDIKSLYKYIKSKSNLSKINIQENTISGKITDMRINYEKYGGKYMTTLIILNHDLNADFTLELKANRYRLTIKNMVFTDKSSAFAYNTTNSEVNNYKLDEYVVNQRKGKFKKGNTRTTGLKYCKMYFTDFFKYQKPDISGW